MLETAPLSDPYPNKCYLPFILYPPGMHRVTGGVEWLEGHVDLQRAGSDFVLYLGVPFCRTRCKSCPYFASLLSENDTRGREERYVDALIADLRHWARYRRFGTGLVRTIFIGGGTGSILKTANLRRLVDAVYSSFQVADDAEFTLEGNARDFDEEKIDYVVRSQINRLSLGVQSFQPEILGVIGSPHAAQDSARVIREFQARGFTPHDIWAVWVDVNAWRTWDDGIESSRLNGRFTVGSTIGLTRRGGDPVEGAHPRVPPTGPGRRRTCARMTVHT
ncbi:radical SAM protein [Frankia canadensis]|nr:radical SAM protein [Frankia canadensis]